MARRSAPIVLLIWLVLLSVAGAIWALLHEAAPEATPPVDDPAADVETGAAEDRETGSATWTLKGCVYGEHGRFQPGAHVEVGGRRVTTDARGEFDVPDLPWKELDVVAWMEDHTVDTQRVAPGTHAELRIRPLRTIEGVVRLPDGTPVSGHPVRLALPGGGARHTTTDANGTFVFEAVPTGRHHVRARALARSDDAFLSVGARIAAGERDVILELPAADAFRGRVVGPDGTPVEGAEVQVRFYRHGRTRDGERTTTDPDGRFAVVVPLEQQCSVLVDTPTPEDGWRFMRWYRHRILPSDGPLDVRLDEGAVISGHVIADRGVPVAGRRVSAFRIAGRARNLITHGVVKRDGTFRIGGLWEAEYELRVSDLSGEESSAAEGLLSTPNRAIASGSTDVELRLHRARPLAGRLVDAAGAPCKNATIFVLQSRLRFTATARTDHFGCFEIARVPPGSLRLIARPGGEIGSDVECGTWHGGDTNVDLRLSE